MSLDFNHHCPVCGKKGNKRCLKLRHIYECDTHKGRFHSKFNECVACAEARARDERHVSKYAEQQDGESTDNSSSDGKQRRQKIEKMEKKGKIRGSHEKSIKQLRREKRQARTSSSSA